MSEIVYTDRETLIAERDQIVEKLGLTVEEYSQKIANDDLEGDEWTYYMEFKGIMWLLGG